MEAYIRQHQARFTHLPGGFERPAKHASAGSRGNPRPRARSIPARRPSPATAKSSAARLKLGRRASNPSRPNSRLAVCIREARTDAHEQAYQCTPRWGQRWG